MDSASPDNGRRSWTPILAASALLTLILALALRIAGARGALWIDEIWSLHLIDEMKASGDVLRGIANDNDHYLNTVYLFLIGPNASPLAQRALSVVLGLVTVMAAGAVQRRQGMLACLAAMILFAVSYPFVNYGSEARGYSGLILCALLSIGIAEGTLLEREPRRKPIFGIVNAIGTLFQPMMIGLIAALAARMVWTEWRVGGRLREAITAALAEFSWTVRLLIPVAAVMAIAIIHTHGYVFGSTVAFGPLRFAAGYGGIFQALLGLPERTPWEVSVALGLALLGSGAVMYRQNACARFPLYLILIAGLPAAMFLARLPNTHIPRYHLFAAVAALLLTADLVAFLGRRGNAAKCAGIVLIGAIVFGNAIELGQFYRFGRSHVATAIRGMADGQPLTVTSNMDRDRWAIGYSAGRSGVPLVFSDLADVCAKRPRWLLTSDPREMPETTLLGSPQCTLTYRRQARYPSWGLSGLPWTLYRAAD